MSLFATIAFATPTLWVLLLAVTTCALLLRCRRLVRGTTLVGPWWWTLGSLGSIGAAHLVAAWLGGNPDERSTEMPANWETAVLFAAASTSFCPFMSLLGAKRPQDRGWHFVVLSLWVILVLPVAESLVLRRGQMPDVQGARSWFMLILIGLGITNSLATRFWLPALLFGGGQLLMLASWLPLVRAFVATSPTVVGFSCCAIACLIAVRQAFQGSDAIGRLDLVWRDFRDMFGLLWGLRVAEQINIAARSSEWPLALRWRGFVDPQGQPLELSSLPEETRESLQQVIQNLLRRFVSPAWIAERMNEGVDL